MQKDVDLSLIVSSVPHMPLSLERQHTLNEDVEDEEDDSIWPQWVVDAKIMRFPRSDIDFDKNRPLGCGNYGDVYNGKVKYGTARYSVIVDYYQMWKH